ncbi:MAG TPA: hypothetical protein ENH15_00940, partial [Actinobacteria bacterium]|nr:hypothetical protein [Actinomycetota bacterium]
MKKRTWSLLATAAVFATLVFVPSTRPVEAAVSDYTWDTAGLEISGETITAIVHTGYGVALGTFGIDYTVSAVCTMAESLSGGYWCGVQARQDAGAPAFETTQAYLFSVGGSNGDKEIAIHRLGEGTSQEELVSMPFDYQANVPYTMTLTVEGDKITGCLNGTTCISANDGVLTSGTAGVGIRKALSNNLTPEITGFIVDGDVSAGFDGTFSDDDGSVHEGMIEAIYAEGITVGCSAADPTLFCPGGGVTRRQMASFIARALELPPANVDYFTDDDGDTHEDNINRVAEAGIALGIGGGLYDQGALVSRAQMASFLARAYDLPATGTDFFTDDDGD